MRSPNHNISPGIGSDRSGVVFGSIVDNDDFVCSSVDRLVE
jgi:hypothetical protein